MSIEPIGHGIYCVDLHPLELEEYIAAYVLNRGQVVIIDCGPSSTIENLLDALAEVEVDPAEIRQILLTHIHVDHAGGAGLLSKKAPHAKVYVHEKGAYHLTNPEVLWSSTKRVLGELAEEYGEIQPVPKERVVTLSGGERIPLERTEIAVVETPGHAPHHLCFWDISSGGI
ncbi:MAG: MBL fold metallo-hydrolase, partial [Candidatus Geothermarchaeales archaeon]